MFDWQRNGAARQLASLLPSAEKSSFNFVGKKTGSYSLP
jgi:hypothetical protein